MGVLFEFFLPSSFGPNNAFEPYNYSKSRFIVNALITTCQTMPSKHPLLRNSMNIAIRFSFLAFSFPYTIKATEHIAGASRITEPTFHDFFSGTAPESSTARESSYSRVPSGKSLGVDLDLRMGSGVGSPVKTHDTHPSGHGIENEELGFITRPTILPEPLLDEAPNTRLKVSPKPNLGPELRPDKAPNNEPAIPPKPILEPVPSPGNAPGTQPTIFPKPTLHPKLILDRAPTIRATVLPEPTVESELRPGRAYPGQGLASSSKKRPLPSLTPDEERHAIHRYRDLHMNENSIDRYNYFWKPKTALVKSDATEQGGHREQIKVNLEPNDEQKIYLKTRYPEEATLSRQFGAGESQTEYSMPFELNPHAQAFYQYLQQIMYSRTGFRYNSHPNPGEKCAGQIFEDATLQGKHELGELGLPASNLYANDVLPIPYITNKQIRPHTWSPKRLKVDLAATPKSRQGETTMDTSGPSKIIELSSKRRKAAPVKYFSSLDLARIWIEYTVPATVHHIRTICEMFPDLNIRADKTVRELQWDAWQFFYVLINHLDRIHSSHEIWESKSAMRHKTFVDIISSIGKPYSTRGAVYGVGGAITHKLLAVWLSCNHYQFFEGVKDVNQALSKTLVGLLNDVYRFFTSNPLPGTPKNTL